MIQRAKPVVSVIIPAFNASQTMARTLDSVMAQTFKDFECLIVDDGSTDETASIITQYCGADSRFHTIRQENLGVARARNAALAKARGGLVAPLDADDLWHPDYLKSHVCVLNSAPPSITLTYCFARVIDVNDRVLGTVLPYEMNGNIRDALRYHNWMGNPSMCVIKREAMIEAGGYDQRLEEWGSVGSEDWLLAMRIATVSEVRAIPLYLTGYRIGPNSMSSDRPRMARSCALAQQIYAIEMAPSMLPQRVIRWQRSTRSFHDARQAFALGKIVGAFRQICSAFLLDPAHISARLADLIVSCGSRFANRETRSFDELKSGESFKSHLQNRPFSHWLIKRRLIGLATPCNKRQPQLATTAEQLWPI